MYIIAEQITSFKKHLISEERSNATVEKYVRDVLAFSEWLCGREVDKNIVVEYKAHLAEKYQTSSTNSMLSSLNSFFVFCERHDFRVKFIKTQKQLFSRDEKELTKAEYLRHLFARTFYTIQKDIVRLSSILGHSSINTTMIYTMESGRIHQKQIQQLGLLC